MIQKYKNKLEEKGVSPVIGVILLVAVTVALVALSTVIVFNIGSDVSDTADITLDVSEQDDSVDITVVRNENVAELRLVGPDTDESFSSNVGSTATITGEAGSYNIVAVLDDGSEETVRTVTIAEDGEVEGESVEGVVETNPAIEGAIVEAYENGELVDDVETNDDGEYTLTVPDREQAEIVVSVERFEYEDANGNDVILSASGSVDASGETDFNFDVENNGEEVTVDGETITVVNQVEDDVTKIGNVDQLQAMNNNFGADYKLVRNIDASGTSEWNNGAGFDPIGEDFDNTFEGSLDGQGYEIDGLYIDRPDEDDVGLIRVNDGTVNNISVVNVDITGDDFVGGIVSANYGEVIESYAEGSVTGEGSYVGGLVGYNRDTVSESYATESVSGEGNSVGGLVGYNDGGTVSESYSTGSVTGNRYVGGLIGENLGGTVSESYATGSVSGDSEVGGLIGTNDNGEVSKSYATGSVSGDSEVGGLVGQKFGTVSESYWDTESSGLEDSDGGTGLETDEMQGDDYDDDFETDIVDNESFVGVTDDYPILEWQE